MNNKKQYNKIAIIQSLPFICLFVGILSIISKNFYISLDDYEYLKVPINLEFYRYIVEGYLSWSSRVLIDSFAVIISKMPDIFIILTLSLVYTLIAYFISNLLDYDNNILKNILVCLLMLIFPYEIEKSAGIVATTINYIFPVLFALICLNHFIKIEKNGSKIDFFLGFMIAFFIATDSEQISLIAFFGFIVYFAYCLYNKKDINKYLILYFCVLLLKMMFIILCPGNHYRYSTEIIDRYSDYSKFNFIDKIIMGILYTTRVLFVNPIIIIIFSVILFFLTFIKNNKKIHTIIATISTFFIIFFIINKNFAIKEVIFYNGPYYSILIFIPIIMFVINLLLIINNYKMNRVMIVLIYILGIISQMLMAFSPTIYASSYRTGTIMYFSFIILIFFGVIEILNVLKLDIEEHKHVKMIKRK
ncbi:MAG: hypothetical protein IKM97_02955 [Clostridia bacterium]|nr:hypothetical protein [Clostridia bacterium]